MMSRLTRMLKLEQLVVPLLDDQARCLITWSSVSLVKDKPAQAD